MSDHDHSNEIIRCSFCGIEKSPEVPLISGNEGRICEACVKLAHQVVSSWGQVHKKVSLSPQLRTPSAIKKHLDDYVVGQEAAKETLAIAVYNHYLRLLNSAKVDLSENDDVVELEKSNVLLVGPSGTGKTLIVRSLAKILGVPFVSADATSLTQAGYVGDDVDSIVARLLDAADGDVNQAQWGIVYIDEIDKIARRGGGATNMRDVSGEGVQQALLKLVEGSEMKVPKPGRRREGGEDVRIDTRNILFIVGGAFPGLEELIGNRVQPAESSIGFHSTPSKDRPPVNRLLASIQPDDLQSFGLIPEFIGRFPIISFLEELDVESLLKILTEPKNALIKQYRQLFAYQGVQLDISEGALDFIASDAVERKTGARGLRSVLESALHKTMFEMPGIAGLRSCILDVETDSESGAKKLFVRREIDELAAAEEERAAEDEVQAGTA